MHDDGSIPTRQSLLERLKDWENQDGWRRFFETYRRLIHAAARKAGLTDDEAQEVVQEVMIAAAKKLPEFTYDPAKDSLKGWLLAVTRWKVADQFRRRLPADVEPSLDTAPEEPAADTAAADHGPGEGGSDFEAIWDDEWRANLLHAALDRVKRQVNPAHYELYHLHVVEGHPPRETARALGVNVAQVYLAKLRVGRRLRQEVALLQRQILPVPGATAPV